MIWYFIGLAIVVGLLLLHYVYPRKGGEWLKLPFLAEYLLQHPECKTADTQSARCHNCQSKKVVYQQLTNNKNPRYKHICLNCKQPLFRS